MSSKKRKGNDIYTVEKIINERTNAKGVQEFFVKWEGYPASGNTWEPGSNILDKTLIDEWVDEKKRKAKAAPKWQHLVTKAQPKYTQLEKKPVPGTSSKVNPVPFRASTASTSTSKNRPVQTGKVSSAIRAKPPSSSSSKKPYFPSIYQFICPANLEDYLESPAFKKSIEARLKCDSLKSTKQQQQEK